MQAFAKCPCDTTALCPASCCKISGSETMADTCKTELLVRRPSATNEAPVLLKGCLWASTVLQLADKVCLGSRWFMSVHALLRKESHKQTPLHLVDSDHYINKSLNKRGKHLPALLKFVWLPCPGECALPQRAYPSLIKFILKISFTFSKPPHSVSHISDSPTQLLSTLMLVNRPTCVENFPDLRDGKDPGPLMC